MANALMESANVALLGLDPTVRSINVPIKHVAIMVLVLALPGDAIVTLALVENFVNLALVVLQAVVRAGVIVLIVSAMLFRDTMGGLAVPHVS